MTERIGQGSHPRPEPLCGTGAFARRTGGGSTGCRPPRALRIAALVLPAMFVLALVLPRPAYAQTTSTGAVAGTIVESGGGPLDGVQVTLVRTPDGAEHTVTASREGRFRIAFLPPGDYLLIAERFGFVPVRVTDVPVRSGESATVRLEFRAATPPVTEVERRTFGEVGGGSVAGARAARSRADLDRIPLRTPTLGGVLAAGGAAGAGIGAPELPARFTTALVDGTPVDGVVHPRRALPAAPFSMFPTFFLQEVAVGADDLDVERGAGPGALLRASTVQGTNEPTFDLFANGVMNPLGAEARLGGDLDPAFAPHAGVLFRGPIMRDTMHVAAGLEFRRMNLPLTGFGFSSDEQLSDWMQGAGALPGRVHPNHELRETRPASWDLISGFGRMDWTVGQRSRIDLRAHLGMIRSVDDEAAVTFENFPTPPQADEGTDLLVAAGLLTPFGDRTAFEMRASVEQAERVHLGGVGPFQQQIGGFARGQGAGMGGTVSQRTLRLDPTFHFGGDRHRFKAGGFIAFMNYEEEGLGSSPLTAQIRPGGAGSGWLNVSTVPGIRSSSHSAPRLGGFLQDRWSAAEGLVITMGVRIDGEVLPWEDITGSDLWRQATGIDEDVTREAKPRVAPRLGVEWEPVPGSGWTVRAGAGVYHGLVNPGLMAEMLADTGQVQVQRTLDQGGGVADGPRLESSGRTLSLAGPRFRAPRTQGFRAGVEGQLSERIGLELSGALRETDFLARRRDLNLVPGVFGIDPFGRPIRGEVVQGPGVPAIVPGSDRRFPGFDTVWGLESDGWARWWGLTAALSFRGASDPATGERPWRAEVSYTFSDARDNAAVSPWAEAPVVPGRPGAAQADASWIEGRSDLDRPHDLSLTGEVLLVAGADLRVGALYRYLSGVPFTPGVRDLLHGSDPLGWDRLAPAALPASSTSGLDELTRSWPCLRDLSGGTRERNVCRGEAVQELNLRATVAPGALADRGIRLRVDVLNLLDAGAGIPDPAAFIVDGSAPFEAHPDGSLTLPFRVNPGFGQSLIDSSPGRSLRIGLDVRF